MRMTRLRGACDPKPTCPTLYLTDRGTLIVQGWVVATPDLALSPGETVVEVPVSLLWAPPAAVPRLSPALRLTGRDTAIVRGHMIEDPEVLARLSLPDGETAVEVSISALSEVVRNAQ